ncbi:MAG: hypothetical protein ACXV5B_02585 [Halobacteriota archaeon]
MISLKHILSCLALISLMIVLVAAASSAQSMGQSAGTQSVGTHYTNVQLRGPTSGHAGDTLTFTSRAQNCTQITGFTACQDISSGIQVVFYVEAPSASDNQVQQQTLENGQAQASFTFAKSGQYTVSAITGDGTSAQVVKIAQSAGQTQGAGATAASSNSSESSPGWLWPLVLGVIILIAIIVVVLLVWRRRYRGDEHVQDE